MHCDACCAPFSRDQQRRFLASNLLCTHVQLPQRWLRSCDRCPTDPAHSAAIDTRCVSRGASLGAKPAPNRQSARGKITDGAASTLRVALCFAAHMQPNDTYAKCIGARGFGLLDPALQEALTSEVGQEACKMMVYLSSASGVAVRHLLPSGATRPCHSCSVLSCRVPSSSHPSRAGAPDHSGGALHTPRPPWQLLPRPAVRAALMAAALDTAALACMHSCGAPAGDVRAEPGSRVVVRAGAGEG